MAYTRRSSRETFAQKAKKFIVKSMMYATAATGASGAVYHYYLTREDIDATVTSVNGATVHTDKGTFVNEPTYAYNKGEEKTADIAKKLQPGEKVRLAVYGARPQIGAFTLEDFSIYRNIFNVTSQSSTAAAAPVPAVDPAASAVVPPAVGASAAPVQTGLLVAPPVVSSVIEDQTKARACAMTGNPADVAQKTPALSRDLAFMVQLPLTGVPIYNKVADPKNKIESCLDPVPEGYIAGGVHVAGTTVVGRNSGSSVYFHELFHAHQDIYEQNKMFELTIRDAAVANLLDEAAAVAYQLVVEQEAQNHGLKFPFAGEGEGASDRRVIRQVFNQAYDAAMTQHASADDTTRQAKALEAAGKATVRYLLKGEDAYWKSSYAKTVVENMNGNLHAFANDGRENQTGYAAKRAEIYSYAGLVSPRINLIPDEFLGANPESHIASAFSAIGLKTTRVSAAPLPTPKMA